MTKNVGDISGVFFVFCEERCIVKIMSKKDLFEIADTVSSMQFDAHREMLKKLQSKGFVLDHQETKEELGLDGECVANVLESTFHPPISSLPFVRFEAREIFGQYNYTDETFNMFDVPKFEVKAFRRGAELHQRNDPWEVFDFEI